MDPTSSPQPSTSQPPQPPPGRTVKMAVSAIILASMPLFGYAVCEATENDAGLGAYVVSVGLALVGLVLGLIQIARGTNMRYGLVAVLLSLVTTAGTLFAGIAHSGGITSGRPLRRRGRTRVPDCAQDDGQWTQEMTPIDAPARAADGWRANAATEAASVAAFAHLSNELLALGAPLELIRDAQQDALDELRHAKLCYSIAQAIDGQRLGPAPFPEAMLPRDRSVTFEAVAADCVIESCLYEAASAKAARRLSEGADVPEPILFVLRTIATDEARHAEHGMKILAFCLSKGGDGVSTAIDQALQGFELSTDAEELQLERFGLAGKSLWLSCLGDARAELQQYFANTSPTGRREAM